MPRSFTALGILPLALFGAYLAGAVQDGRAADSLWMCHVSNLLLALALFGNWASLVGLAVAWIVLGVPLWIYDVWHTGAPRIVSSFAHLGGLAVGLYALSQVRVRHNPWLYALVLYLVVQQLCRWLTPAELNVNLAHRAYERWDGVPGGYGAYWIATTSLVALALWGIGRLLMFAFPPQRDH